ncbi:NRDE family protein [Planococcus salinus]|uniref:NRDE family protein n=1 Tax=Planococcus salinus TaxID=1848460 RepID=A0A3M8P711_9BACL|nr:NRDE family protein [Planococcus salinus]RNF39469.1 NRDE family protein [Planococcus salinus]
MCLINFQYKSHPKYKLVIAANRDEFYGRPTAAAQFWEEEPNILAGRDLLQNGTWLGVTKNGRFAALTNFRDPSEMDPRKISRGMIVRNFLAGHQSPEEFLKTLNKEDYTGFNVLVGDTNHLFYYNNLQGDITEVPPGTHGLSNHYLNTPWPKVVKGRKNLEAYLSTTGEVQLDSLFHILSDAEQAPDSHLPETGVGLDFERKLSSIFIKTPDYGTRSATVVLVDHDNHVTFAERTYEKGEFKEQKTFEFTVQ